MSEVLYWIVKKVSSAIISLYFRETYIVGQENIPEDGPTIFCGNHSNQFIDPVMIISNTERKLSFTIAASSFSKPVIGNVAKALRSIPVSRPEDHKVKGKGKIKFLSNVELEASGIDFLEDIKKIKDGFSINILNKTFVVDKVVDSTHLTIKKNEDEFKDVVIDQQYDFFYIPKIDNTTLFKSAYEVLAGDGSICIFPEGTSHDRTEFIKLKAGIAFMALGAMSEYNTKNVKIVPVGLNYFNREQFRSEVIIEFGKAFEIPAEWGKEFKTNKRETTEKLLKEIESRMKAVTLTAPTFNELKSVHYVRKLYVPPGTKLTPLEYSELCKRFVKGYEKLKEKEDCKYVFGEVRKYTQELISLGITDHEVKEMSFSYTWMLKNTLTHILLFHIYAIFALPGVLIMTPFSYLIQKKAEKERLAAKAKNPNKIEALDVVSSVKVVHSIMYLPGVYILWCLLICLLYSFRVAHYIEISLFTRLVIASISFWPYIYYVTKAVDYLSFYFFTIYSRFVYFVKPSQVVHLRETRDALHKTVKEFIDKYIEEVDPKYKEDRILFNELKATRTAEDEKSQLLTKNSKRKLKRNSIDELDTLTNFVNLK